jgi:hypothetical protein
MWAKRLQDVAQSFVQYCVPSCSTVDPAVLVEEAVGVAVPVLGVSAAGPAALVVSGVASAAQAGLVGPEVVSVESALVPALAVLALVLGLGELGLPRQRSPPRTSGCCCRPQPSRSRSRPSIQRAR